MDIEFKNDINEAYLDFFKSTEREALLYGGAGAGKSYASGQKIILNCLLFENQKILIIRKTYPSLKLTSLELIEKLLNQYKIPYAINKTDLIIRTIKNNKLIFKSLDDPEKIKSITDVNHIWIEEPTELSDKEYEIINLRLRGQELGEGEYRQIIMSFNPIDKNHWLYKNYFEHEKQNVYKKKFTYKDNKFIDSEYKKVLEDLKNQDEYLYNVYCLGEWGTIKGQIYNNYVIKNFDMINFDEVIAGLDYGWNSPSAYLLIGLKDEEIYIIDEIYQTKLTTPELVELIKEKNKEWNVKPTVYCEHEPDRTAELSRAGLITFDAKKDVIPGINFLKSRRIWINERCVNTIKEIQGYKYKENRDGTISEEPAKYNDHAMDAMRYAVFTHYLRGKTRVFTKKPFGL